MADELNGRALPVHHTNLFYKNYNFKNEEHFTVLWPVTLKIGAL